MGFFGDLFLLPPHKRTLIKSISMVFFFFFSVIPSAILPKHGAHGGRNKCHYVEGRVLLKYSYVTLRWRFRFVSKKLRRDLVSNFLETRPDGIFLVSRSRIKFIRYVKFKQENEGYLFVQKKTKKILKPNITKLHSERWSWHRYKSDIYIPFQSIQKKTKISRSNIYWWLNIIDKATGWDHWKFYYWRNIVKVLQPICVII